MCSADRRITRYGTLEDGFRLAGHLRVEIESGFLIENGNAIFVAMRPGQGGFECGDRSMNIVLHPLETRLADQRFETLGIHTQGTVEGLQSEIPRILSFIRASQQNERRRILGIEFSGLL